MSVAWAILIPIFLVLAMMLCVAAGRWMGELQLARGSSTVGGGATTFEVTTSELVALLLAFTVASAAQRFDARRRLIVEESNTIGTAYLRLELLPPDTRQRVKQLFRAYVDARIAAFRTLPERDLSAAMAVLVQSEAMQTEIWTLVLEAVQAQPAATPLALLLLPALSQMMDLARTRTLLSQLHPPITIFIMLVVVLLANSVYAGYGMAGAPPNWIPAIGVLCMKAFVFSAILDLEFPRAGFLREESFDQAFMDLRRSMQ